MNTNSLAIYCKTKKEEIDSTLEKVDSRIAKIKKKNKLAGKFQDVYAILLIIGTILFPAICFETKVMYFIRDKIPANSVIQMLVIMLIIIAYTVLICFVNAFLAFVITGKRKYNNLYTLCDNKKKLKVLAEESQLSNTIEKESAEWAFSNYDGLQLLVANIGGEYKTFRYMPESKTEANLLDFSHVDASYEKILKEIEEEPLL